VGKLAKLAGTHKLSGPVAVTGPAGTVTYADEDAAEEAVGGKSLFHYRGAFYEEGCTPKGYVAPAPATEAKPRRKKKTTAITDVTSAPTEDKAEPF
jgi:hypothetical protein